MTHDEARDVMPLHVLDADDAATRAELLEHLAGCDACREALREYQLAADALAQSVPEESVPGPSSGPELWRRSWVIRRTMRRRGCSRGSRQWFSRRRGRAGRRGWPRPPR